MYLLDTVYGEVSHILLFNRHTSDLEAFNSMLLKYAGKRFAFKGKAMDARSKIAAIDHNTHINRPLMKSKKTGEEIYLMRYSKRSRNFSVSPCKEPKTYPYVPRILTDMLQARADANFQDAPPEMEYDDPRRICPTIAMKAAPIKKDLIEKAHSRK